MDEELEHNLELMKIFTRRLRFLELQIARVGGEASPQLQMEVEEVRTKVAELNKYVDSKENRSSNHQMGWPTSDLASDKLKKPVKQIAVFGKTGCGKSLLLSRFTEQRVQVGHVVSTTRSVKSYHLSIDSTPFTLTDCPGIGESIELDEEYGNLYKELLEVVDIIIWVMKADDRAIKDERSYFRGSLKPFVAGKKPLYIALNQVDLMYPHDTWDVKSNCPSLEQMSNINDKISYLSGAFSLPRSRIVPISVLKNYNTDQLRNLIISEL